MASHEFRTPLSTILSSLSLIEKYDEKGEESKDKKVKHYCRVRSNVKNLTAILNDFLSIDKLQSGMVEVGVTTFDLNQFVLEIINDFENELQPDQKIKLNFTGVNGISTDERILRNVMINLLSNASKYSKPEGLIEINIDNTDTTTIEVKDYGIGIPDEDKKHMFERFFRAKNATNIKGTGLGLTIIKRYLELLNGTISFESEHEKGTSFVFTLNNSKAITNTNGLNSES